MGRLDNYFFNTLPDYFKIYDTYKDVSGNGLLERYLDVFQAETEVYEQEITDLGTLPYPQETPEDFLDYIADMFGLPPIIKIGETAMYRDLLTHIIKIYQWKGTIEGLQRFFSIWGFAATITLQTKLRYQYDVPDNDYDEAVFSYDQGCSYCYEVDMDLTTVIGTPIVDPTDLIPLVERAWEVLAPINATLGSLTWEGNLPDQPYLVDEHGNYINIESFDRILANV